MTSSVLAATLLASAAVFFAADVSADSNNAEEGAAPVADEAPPCCSDIEAAPPPPEIPPDLGPGDAVLVANVDGPPQSLPAGIASEPGLQVKTILVSRSISEVFPQVHNMIGVRPDSQRWHPSGLALDVMIPNPGSAEGVALGDQIVAFAMRNADRFALQDAIWRGRYYTPGGHTSSGYGHFDHVHITTFGGGYPAGNEEYLRDDGAPPADS